MGLCNGDPLRVWAALLVLFAATLAEVVAPEAGLRAEIALLCLRVPELGFVLGGVLPCALDSCLLPL